MRMEGRVPNVSFELNDFGPKCGIWSDEKNPVEQVEGSDGLIA